MAIDRRKAVLFGAAVAVRLLLFTAFPSLPVLLTGRVEISTPVTSFKRCIDPILAFAEVDGILTRATVQEGLFLYTHNVSPYDGGVFHQVALGFPDQELIPWDITDFSPYRLRCFSPSSRFFQTPWPILLRPTCSI
jgi:phosphatidylinositol glycan class U